MKKVLLSIFLLCLSLNFFGNEFNSTQNSNIINSEDRNVLNAETEQATKNKLDFRPTGSIFKLELKKDSLILSSALLLISADFIIQNLDHDTAMITNKLNISEVNKIDQILMRPYSKKLDLLGTGFELLTAITPLFLLSTPTTEWTTIAGMYAETMLFAFGFKEFAKAIFDRPRPYMYFDNFPYEEVGSGDWNASFFSGHTTLAFAAATFTTYVFCKYKPESKWKIPVIATSYTLAVATAGLRILSGNHFATDVAIGAVVGSITGLLIPFWHYVNPENPMGVIGNTDSAYLSVAPTALSFTIKM